MSLPKYKELENLESISKIEEEIYILQKILFDLRMKKATQKDVKSHLFMHTKRRIAQLNLKKTTLLNVN